MVTIRPATLDDLPQIVALEIETFDPIGSGAAATEPTLYHRINLCNSAESGWYWIAEYQRSIVGSLIMLPTNMTPDECVSWDYATDSGQMSQFDHTGRNIFVVSGNASEKRAPAETINLLIKRSLELRQETGKYYYMFCSRMPGFQAAHNKTNISPEAYWQLRMKNGAFKDSHISMWTETFGEPPYKLLVNGWPPDIPSGGHAVCFALTDSVKNLMCIEQRLQRAYNATEQKQTTKRRRNK